MAEGDVRQYWVRNDRGTLWGPLTLPTIELLIDSGSIKGKLQVSEDGINFAFPWRFPEARDTFPRELWGDGAPDVPRGAGSAPAIGQSQWTGADGGAPVAGPGANPGGMPTAGPGANPGGAPMAGPGAVARPGPGAAPMAGPGTRPGDPRVPGNPMAAQQGARPGVPGAVPGAPNVAARPAPGVATAPGVASAPGRPATAPGAGVAPQAGAAARPAGAPQAPGGVAPQAGAPAAVARPAGAPQAPGGVAPPAGATNVGAPPARAPGSPQSGSHAAVVTEASGYAVPARGQLEQTSPLNLYGRMASAELTGLLTLTLSDRVTLIHFRKGNPEYVDSTHAEDALGTSLMGAKLLNPEQLQQAESAKERFGGDLLAALFGLGLLQPASAFAILAQRASSILFKGLRAEAGTFTFEVRELAGNKSMPLGNRWAVLSDTVRRMPSTDIKRRLMPVLQLPIMKAGGMVAASDLRLTPHEVRALTVIDGVRSVNQLLTDFPQDADHLLRIAFLLRELDAVSFAAVSPTSAGPRPAAPTPGATAASPQPAPGAAARGRPAQPLRGPGRQGAVRHVLPERAPPRERPPAIRPALARLPPEHPAPPREQPPAIRPEWPPEPRVPAIRPEWRPPPEPHVLAILPEQPPPLLEPLAPAILPEPPPRLEPPALAIPREQRPGQPALRQSVQPRVGRRPPSPPMRRAPTRFRRCVSS
ncbi:DUF4388 domain-containing protein [Myxococcus eversor]|uniref:DUF4388 domain-containing protein n=1 Tax=Myxococcus eversor TaxID=2709661 RepID=UPI001F075DAC|nr:DUF4388 domain-containing protein [Myxococcus eversor]